MIGDPRGAIDYHEEGSGPAILFVPGSWGTRSAWRGVIAALGAQGRPYRIITMSLLGFGGTAERRTAADAAIESEAEVVEAAARHAGTPVHLVGHSYGGQVCLAVALRGRVPLKSLTLIEVTAFPLLRHTGDRALYEEVAAMQRGYVRAFEGGDKEAARRVIDFYGGDGTFDAFPERMRDHVAATTPTNILDWRCGFGFDPPLAEYAGITVPSLLIRGERGHASIRRCAEVLAQTMPRASVVAMPGASHFMMATHPRETAELIARHVAAAEDA